MSKGTHDNDFVCRAGTRMDETGRIVYGVLKMSKWACGLVGAGNLCHANEHGSRANQVLFFHVHCLPLLVALLLFAC